MGAGRQRWWRDYDSECRAWSDRDVEWRKVLPDGGTITRYRDGSTIYVSDGIEARLKLWI